MPQSELMFSWNDYLQSLETFEVRLLKILDDIEIYESCKSLAIDHVCIRLSTVNQVDILRQELQTIGEEISVAEVNGRDIVIVLLHQALQVANWQVDTLELPYPKKNHAFIDGWEHVEFVLPNAENTIEGMRQTFFENFPSLDLDTLKSKYYYKEDAPYVEGEQLSNPTIGIKVDGVGIKFHANSIQDVVRSG